MVAICYVSAYGFTKSLALAIEQGIRQAGVEDVRLFDLVTDDHAQAAAAVSASDGFLLGSPHPGGRCAAPGV